MTSGHFVQKRQAADYPAACFHLWEGGEHTATTRLITHHISKGETVAQSLKDRFDYGQNPEKTQGGELISAYERSPATVVKIHTNQNISGKHFLFGFHPTATFFDLGDRFGGDFNSEDTIFKTKAFNARLETLLDLILIARIGVQDVPFFAHSLCSQT